MKDLQKMRQMTKLGQNQTRKDDQASLSKSFEGIKFHARSSSTQPTRSLMDDEEEKSSSKKGIMQMIKGFGQRKKDDD